MNGPTIGDVYDGSFPSENGTIIEVWFYYSPGKWTQWSRTHNTWEWEFEDYASSCNMMGPWRLKEPTEQVS